MLLGNTSYEVLPISFTREERNFMQIEWKNITLEDKTIIDSYYKTNQSRSCERTFANNFLWAPHYHTMYAIVNNMLLFKSEDNGMMITFPIGNGNLEETILLLEAYFEEKKQPFRLTLVTEEQYKLLEETFPNKFQIEYDRDSADYIYEAEKLISLSGKKLHSKRNHINKFKADHNNWSFERITKENKKECFAMAVEWCKRNGCTDDPNKSAEICVTLKALELLETLELEGGLIRDNGEVIAFSIGESCSEDTYVVHIEKAYADIQGAYPIMNQQFVENIASNYLYINREEDTGAEGLRKAKLSYYPVFLQEKGLVTLG